MFEFAEDRESVVDGGVGEEEGRRLEEGLRRRRVVEEAGFDEAGVDLVEVFGCFAFFKNEGFRICWELGNGGFCRWKMGGKN